ncbi:MAG: hypothetical protein QW469_00340 [Candidatus Aenigmatarchaeota archaeon]
MPTNISNLQKVNNAHKRRETFIQIHAKSHLLELRLIWEIWKNKDWNALGFDSFKDYCEAPIESGGLGISRAWAIQMAEVYQKYVKELKVPEKKIVLASPRKLYEIRKIVNEKNVEEWLNKVVNLSLEDLEREKKNIDIVNCNHQWENFRRCKICKIWEKIDKKL